MALTLEAAQIIVREALAHARRQTFKPLSIVVLDARAAVVAAASEDGTSLKRFEIARGKANGALEMGLGSRALYERAEKQAYFLLATGRIFGDGLVPVPGGVLVRDRKGGIIGAVGISGDISDNDEAAAIAGIEAAGFAADPG